MKKYILFIFLAGILCLSCNTYKGTFLDPRCGCIFNGGYGNDKYEIPDYILQGINKIKKNAIHSLPLKEIG